MNIVRIQFIMMAIATMPLISMEHENVVKIMGDVSVISIKESNLVFMKTLHKYSQFHKGKIKQCGIVPRYPYVCSDEICLVDTALTVRPDKFTDYYNKLSKRDRLLLIKASGRYNEDGKKVMLDVPEVTKRLIEVYFTDDGLRNHIKSYLKNEDEDYVRNYFKEQLISSKRLLMLKQWAFGGEQLTKYRLTNDVYLGSVFLNGFHTIHPYDYPISLRMGDKIRQTYGTCFAIDNYEYRITDIHDNQCLLWVVNHNNPDATFSTIIKHKGNIKGCSFSSTKTDVEGVLTYSDHDMVFSTVTTLNGVLFVDSIVVDSPHQIVDVCFEPVKNYWLVGTYEGLDSVVRSWNMEGKLIAVIANLPFKQYALLEKLAISKTACGYRFAEIMGVANMYSTGMSNTAKDNGMYETDEIITLRSPYVSHSYYTSEIIKVGNSVAMFDLRYPFFKENFEDDLGFQLESEVHRVYSPQGTFLMCNSLKKKWGVLYVETVIQDAVTHKQILSIDTLYKGFEGVGFTHDETELIFLDTLKDSKVSLLTYEDKQMLSQIEDVACTNLGVVSLVKRLCMECRENGSVALYDNDPARAMLIDWSRQSPQLLQLLKTCLPITKIKK